MEKTGEKIIPREWVPEPYMKKAVKFLLSHANAGLLLSPGGRKTSCTLAALQILFEKKMIRKVLIIAPKKPCYAVWPSEIEKWFQFNDITFEVLHGSKKDAALARDAQVYLINPDGLVWLLKSTKVKYETKSRSKFGNSDAMVKRVKIDVSVSAFKRLGFDTLIVDEIHQFKNQGSQRFKALKKVIHTFSRRWGLTGSPSANGLEDLFGQCYILDEGRSLGRFVTQFRKEYFDSDYNEVTYTLKPGAEEKIYERISPLMLRLDTDAFQDLPQMIRHDILLDLPSDIRKIYDELEADLITRIQGNTVVASNAASVSMKIRQIASGGIYHTPEAVPGVAKAPRTWSNLHTEKIDALRSLVDELQGSPLLVAYEFEHDEDRMRKEFKIEIAHNKFVFSHDVKDVDFKKMEQRWNKGGIEVLAGNPRSLGIGLNLQDAGFHVCWHTPTWDQMIHEQFNKRVLRSGNTSKNVFVHYLLMRNTIEELMMLETSRKTANQNSLFSALLALAELRGAL